MSAKKRMNCEWCGKGFLRYRSNIHKHNYCCLACGIDARRTVKLRICKYCKCEYTPFRSDRNQGWCTHACYNKWKRDKWDAKCAEKGFTQPKRARKDPYFIPNPLPFVPSQDADVQATYALYKIMRQKIKGNFKG